MIAQSRIFARIPVLLMAMVLGIFAPIADQTTAQQTGLKDELYVSPTWGYSVRWYSSEWTVQQEVSQQNPDSLALTDSLGNVMTFTGSAALGGDAEACLDEVVQTAQATPGATDFLVVDNGFGEPYEWRTPTQAYTVFQLRLSGDDGLLHDVAIYAECQTLVPGEAVFQRLYIGPVDVFEQWYDDVVETIEGVFLPASAWLPEYEDDLESVWAGEAPLRGDLRYNASFLFDGAGDPRLLVGLEDEAGDTRVVTFENVSDEPVTVVPANVALTLVAFTGEVPDQEWPLSTLVWEDGFEADVDGTRDLAPGERATALLDFLPGDLSTVSCAELPLLILEYRPADDSSVDFAVSDLPDDLTDCIAGEAGEVVVGDAAPAGAGRPVLQLTR